MSKVKPIKIAVDVRDLRIAKTGARTYLEELIKAFDNAASDQFIFYYLDTFIPVYTGKNKFLKLIEHARFIIWKQFLLPFKAYLKSCDVIFCTDFFVPYFAFGAQTIPVLHDAFFFEYPQHYNKIWLYLFRKLGVSAAKRSAVIITPTQYTRKQIATYSGIEADQIVAVYEGPKTLPDVDDTKCPFDFPYILHVGVIEKRKNIVNLLRAFDMFRETQPEVKLVLVGQFSPKEDMDDRDAVTTYINDHHLKEHVFFAGYVPDEKLASFYKHALLYVFPSVNEGFGIPVLEAFSLHVPVLIADNTCLPEVAGEAALSFDPFDPQDIATKMLIVARDPDLRNQMIEKGKIRVRKFTWEHTASALMNVFEQVQSKKNDNFAR